MRRAPCLEKAGACLALVLAGRPAAAQLDLDAQRSAWSHSRSVAPPQQRGAFVALTLPPELLARCRADLADLRMVSADGRELPYVVERVRARDVQTRWSGTLVDTRRENRKASWWTVDLGQTRRFDTILLTIQEQSFAKAVRVEASDDRKAWRELAREAGVFDRPWTTRLHHTRIELGEAVGERYLRLTLDDTRSPPVSVTGVEVSSARSLSGESWSRAARVRASPPERGRSRYALLDIAGLPFERLSLEADDAAFSRRVRLLETQKKGGHSEEAALGEGELYRVRVEDVRLEVEALSLDVRPPSGGDLILEVRDDDSPPLRGPRVTVSAAATRLLFPWTEGSLSVYYGNPLTRAQRYDLEAQGMRIAAAGPFPAAQLGAERANQRFQAPLPLAFTPNRGAALEARRWSRQRVFVVTGREDLYSVTLRAADLGVLRPDLADLRVVDEADSQVPFLFETAAATEKPELRTEADTGGSGRSGRGAVSRHRLVMPDLDGEPAAFPVAALELEVADRFFSRPARMIDPEAAGRRGERVIGSATLARSGREEGSPAPLEIAADGRRYRELVLEIEEGDNAPLQIQRVRGLVRVPRLAFKAAPGRYRLLLGNQEAAPARYDIASLRQEFLTYSAVPIEAEPLSPNPGHRRRASEYLKDAPPTLLLWGTLGLAVVALLGLTVRILRQPGVPPGS